MGIGDSRGAAGNKTRRSRQAAMVTDSRQRAASRPNDVRDRRIIDARRSSSFTPSRPGLGPAGSYWPRSGVCVSTQASTCGEYCFTKAAVSPGLSSAPGVVCAPSRGRWCAAHGHGHGQVAQERGGARIQVSARGNVDGRRHRLGPGRGITLDQIVAPVEVQSFRAVDVAAQAVCQLVEGGGRRTGPVAPEAAPLPCTAADLRIVATNESPSRMIASPARMIASSVAGNVSPGLPMLAVNLSPKSR